MKFTLYFIINFNLLQSKRRLLSQIVRPTYATCVIVVKGHCQEVKKHLEQIHVPAQMSVLAHYVHSSVRDTLIANKLTSHCGN